jgi:hypothetical protein
VHAVCQHELQQPDQPSQPPFLSPARCLHGVRVLQQLQGYGSRQRPLLLLLLLLLLACCWLLWRSDAAWGHGAVGDRSAQPSARSCCRIREQLLLSVCQRALTRCGCRSHRLGADLL